MNGNEKILIFTESKDTLDYLVKKIKSWGYKVNSIHGAMSIEDRIKAEKMFRDETQIMVATEAAGEGINLQFCHIMINYDIPWNPNTLEQRMGRIHRYGQKKDVYIFNLVAEDTREGIVLSRLFEKLEEIKDKLGTDRVFDIIGDIFEGKNLYELILDAILNAKSMDEILKELDIKTDENYIAKIKDYLGDSLATKFIDYTRIKEDEQRAREYKLIPQYVMEFFKEAYKHAGGKLRELNNGFIAIDSPIPEEIRDIAKSPEFKNRYGIIMNKYNKVTFDKEVARNNPDAEFISFGHPLLEALIEWTIRKFQDGVKKGSVFIDTSGKLDGYIWFYSGEIKDGKGNIAGRKIFAIYSSTKVDNNKESGELKEVNPALIWDLLPAKNKNYIINEIEINDEKARIFAIKSLENYKKELLVERKKQAEIKEKYGLKSLEYLIGLYDKELIELNERKSKGENVDIVIRNKEEQLRKYKNAKEELIKEISQETNLTMTTPELLTVIKVIPQESEIQGSEEIEKIGMDIAMKYEIDNGREPEDVSQQYLGFDIRSIDKKNNSIRYIEVKARAGKGDIALTRNELLKARDLKDNYFLYVIMDALTHPSLKIIQNPAEKLSMIPKTEIVKYIVLQEELEKKKEEVWKK